MKRDREVDSERERESREVDREVGEANKHFRKLHAFVKTKQCAKCLFVLVSAFQRKNDSAQKAGQEQREGDRTVGRAGKKREGRSDASQSVSFFLSRSVKMLQLLMGLLVVEIIVAASASFSPSAHPAVQPCAKCRAAIMQPHAMTMQHRSELHKASRSRSLPACLHSHSHSF